MAMRRMFSKEVTNSSEFLMMSQSAQNLYFHFGMNADDDGICEVFTVMRMTDSKPDDLKSLHERGFIYVVDSKVCIVKDWHENNQLRSDRYRQSKYLSDKRIAEIYCAVMAEKVAEISQYTDLLSNWQPSGNQVEPQDRIGKDRIGKIDMSVNTDSFYHFWKEYPKKELKKKSQEIWKRKKLDGSIQEILSFISKAKLTDRWKKGFVKQPPTFLNGECWKDDLSSYGSVSESNGSAPERINERGEKEFFLPGSGWIKK